MTAATQRWTRILKVRSIQRQMAEAQLRRCETELHNLVDLGTRISAIRDAAQPSEGAQSGLMMRSVCELSGRLDSAQRALVNPRDNAKTACDRQQKAVLASKQREMAVEKLEAAAFAQIAKQADDKQSRAMIFRKPSHSGDVG